MEQWVFPWGNGFFHAAMAVLQFFHAALHQFFLAVLQFLHAELQFFLAALQFFHSAVQVFLAALQFFSYSTTSVFPCRTVGFPCRTVVFHAALPYHFSLQCCCFPCSTIQSFLLQFCYMENSIPSWKNPSLHGKFHSILEIHCCMEIPLFDGKIPCYMENSIPSWKTLLLHGKSHCCIENSIMKIHCCMEKAIGTWKIPFHHGNPLLHRKVHSFKIVPIGYYFVRSSSQWIVDITLLEVSPSEFYFFRSIFQWVSLP